MLVRSWKPVCLVLPLVSVMTFFLLTSSSGTSSVAQVKPAAKGSKVKLRKSRYGKILVDGKGLTLYLFTRDKGKNRSRCYGDCATAWPPYLTTAKPRAGKGIKKKYLKTTKRSDGTRQVTYRGHPLYYYEDETKAGQILCQAVDQFSGIWYVVNSKGKAIRKS